MTSTTALIVVDVQRDFCEGGALGVQGGNDVARKLGTWIPAAADAGTYGLIVASKDSHSAPPNTNCGHFALEGEPDYVTSWPVHCVVGTKGELLHRSIQGVIDKIDYLVFKGRGTQSYSAFEGVTDVSHGNHSLLALLRSNDIDTLDVCGIATDYCVRATVLDALGLGFKVNVLASMCAGVAPESSMKAMLEMMEKGAVQVQ